MNHTGNTLSDHTNNCVLRWDATNNHPESFDEEDEEKYPELFPVNSSNIFRLMQKVIASPLLNEEPMNLGNLCISWPYDQYSIKEVFENGCLAFERLWHLNSRLIAGR